MLRAALALALVMSPARADILLPTDYLTEQESRDFQLCRAALFYHLDPASAPGQVPLPVARTLLDQINVIMVSTLNRNTVSSVEEGLELLRFNETWILGFSRVLREEQEMLADPAARDAIIMACIPPIWMVLRTNIDLLMAWRAQAIDAPPLPAPAEIYERQQEVLDGLLNGK